MAFNAEKYKNLTDSIADLIKRENELLQKATQADAGGEKRRKFVEQLADTSRALEKLEKDRSDMIHAVAGP